jgi:hypothetical protein
MLLTLNISERGLIQFAVAASHCGQYARIIGSSAAGNP